MARWFFFFLMVAIGALAGLYYGWVLNPVEYVDTAPHSLREDYKSDYVLMVAEAYHAESNLETALNRLAMLGDSSPLESVRIAIEFAMQNSYVEADLSLMRKLAEALLAQNPTLGAAP